MSAGESPRPLGSASPRPPRRDLARRPERLAARGQDPQPGRRRRAAPCDRPATSGQDVLAVVEDQQAALVAQARAGARRSATRRVARGRRGTSAIRRVTEPPGASVASETRCTSASRAGRHRPGQLQGEPALATSARADQRQQARSCRAGRGSRGQVPLPADEARRRARAGRRRPGEGRIVALDGQAQLEERRVRRRRELELDRRHERDRRSRGHRSRRVLRYSASISRAASRSSVGSPATSPVELGDRRPRSRRARGTRRPVRPGSSGAGRRGASPRRRPSGRSCSRRAPARATRSRALAELRGRVRGLSLPSDGWASPTSSSNRRASISPGLATSR